jgi:hypothetical protein
MQFVVPTQQFVRLNAKGKQVTVTRKAYTRRTLKPDAWKYHLREMAVSEEPLRYIRRFLVTHEELHAQRTGAQPHDGRVDGRINGRVDSRDHDSRRS